jgi:hypothetical protein
MSSGITGAHVLLYSDNPEADLVLFSILTLIANR